MLHCFPPPRLFCGGCRADFVSPFVVDWTIGARTDSAVEIMTVFNTYRYTTEVIAEYPTPAGGGAALASAHIATVPFKVLQRLFEHLTAR